MRILPVIAVLMLAACQPANPTTTTTTEASETVVTTAVDCSSAVGAGQTFTFSCDAGKSFTAQYDEGTTCAIVTAGGQTYRVPAAMSASGARYQGGGVEYWEHQGEAMLDGAAGGPYANCKLPAPH
ncbi:MAG TPA: MliC family protein [Caulobacterales bacterium]|nr:MliC family protein [Caulobacterales bacterium]